MYKLDVMFVLKYFAWKSRPEAWCEKVVRENLCVPGVESWRGV